jgi:hypothetical protein
MNVKLFSHDRAEGPAVRPAQGNALGNGKTTIFSGPTGQSFSLRLGEFLARWADRTKKYAGGHSVPQGVALGWANG